MTDLIYATGTVTVSASGTVVSAASGGPLWASNIQEFDTLLIAGYGPVPILGVTDDSHLAIAAWPYGSVTAAAYQILQTSALRFSGAGYSQAVIDLLAALNVDGFYIFVRPDQTVPDPSKGREGQFARQPNTGKEWLRTGGIWVYQGITGNLSFTATLWSSATTYASNVLVPYAGAVWLSIQANNLNHTPQTGSAWWTLFLSAGDAVDVVMFDTDRPADGEDVLELVMTKNITFRAGLTDSRARARVGATSTAVYTYKKNDVAFATLTFAGGGQGGPQTGTFTCAADKSFVPGDYLTITAPSTRDPTLATVTGSLAGYRT